MKTTMDTRREKELCVLACLFDPAAFEVVASTLQPSDFSVAESRHLYLAAKQMYDAGKVDQWLDPVAVLDTCRANGWDVSWQVIVSAHELPWQSTHVAYHCHRLLMESRLDRLRRLGESLKESDDASDEFIGEQITALEQVRENSTELPVVTAAEAVREMLEIRANPAKKQAIGFVAIDNTMKGGVKDGHLIVVGGRPGAGKSALMAQFAVHAAKKNRPALIVSLEMTAAEFVERMATSMNIPEIEQLPLFMTETVNDLDKILSLARVMVRRHKIRMMVVDYLQLIKSTGSYKATREQQVSNCTRALKMLAKELKIPVIVGSQLNRESEKGSKRPTLADLRESGAIEQDADIVFLLSREHPGEPKTFVDLAKHRGGPTQLFTMDLVGREFRFEERNEYEQFEHGTGF